MLGPDVAARFWAKVERKSDMQAREGKAAGGGMTEAEFQRSVVDLATRTRWLVYHTFDSRRSTKGFPDLTCLNGEVGFVAELKADRKKRPSPAQVVWLEAFRAVRFPAFLWTPEDWTDIEAVLTRRVTPAALQESSALAVPRLGGGEGSTGAAGGAGAGMHARARPGRGERT